MTPATQCRCLSRSHTHPPPLSLSFPHTLTPLRHTAVHKAANRTYHSYREEIRKKGLTLSIPLPFYGPHPLLPALVFLSLSSPHFLYLQSLPPPHTIPPFLQFLGGSEEELGGGLSLYRKDYSYINVDRVCMDFLNWSSGCFPPFLWDSFVFVVIGEIFFGGVGGGVGGRWLVAEGHTAVGAWESLPKGKCVCGVCPHRHVDNCKETTLYIKVRFQIAQSRPRAEGALPLPPH